MSCPVRDTAGGNVLCNRSAAQTALKLARSSKIGSCYSVMKFGSPTTQIPLESGSSADKRFRIDQK